MCCIRQGRQLDAKQRLEHETPMEEEFVDIEFQRRDKSDDESDKIQNTTIGFQNRRKKNRKSIPLQVAPTVVTGKPKVTTLYFLPLKMFFL